jgi:hypothetical protein
MASPTAAHQIHDIKRRFDNQSSFSNLDLQPETANMDENS